MLVGLRRSGGLAGGREHSSFALRSIVANAGLILGRTAIYLAFNVLFVITLAFASNASAGGTTVLSYAYLFASYLVAGTGMALGMSNIPDMTRDARAQRQALVDEHGAARLSLRHVDRGARACRPDRLRARL